MVLYTGEPGTRAFIHLDEVAGGRVAKNVKAEPILRPAAGKTMVWNPVPPSGKLVWICRYLKPLPRG